LFCDDNKNSEDVVKVTRGLQTLVERNDKFLRTLRKAEFVYIHESYRQKYINKQYTKMSQRIDMISITFT